jgi:hypothetical protein
LISASFLVYVLIDELTFRISIPPRNLHAGVERQVLEKWIA